MKHQKILDQMTLEEKIVLCSGKDFWHTKEMPQYGISSLMVTDGPHGVRKQKASADMLGLNDSVPSTCFPTAVSTGASWDRELLEEIGKAIGEEALEEQVAVVLGPGVNIKRNPLCGRNFEYFSEDPFLAGEMGAAWVKGVQAKGVGASVKHFAVNSQEYKRFSSDSIIDERTLREIYLPAFEKVVKEARPATVMCAYPKLNGVFCSDNKELLTNILRDEWGFEGMVVTDWGAMNDRMESFAAGCDLSMPGGVSYQEEETVQAVRKHKFDEKMIDQCADRVLDLVLRQQRVLEEAKGFTYDRAAHQKLAKKAAEEGCVLLKNQEKILPLNPSAKLVLVGHMAEEIRYQGAGSSRICPTHLTSLTEAMREIFGDITYIEGCDAKGKLLPGAREAIQAAAKKADAVVVAAGLTEMYDSEGFDRETLAMPEGHDQMIALAAEANPNTVVVLMGGSVMELSWEDQVKGILYAGLCGQEGAGAIAGILAGKVCPGGKLTETWPLNLADVPCADCYGSGHKDAEYREGIYVGYRYYEKSGTPVRYPFGFGLSYTTFSYENIRLEDHRILAEITNTGNVDGAEVVQLYIAAPGGGIFRPVKELKGFARVFLKAGETKTVAIPLETRSFAVYANGWKALRGNYQLMLGASSADIRLSLEIAPETLFAREQKTMGARDYEKVQWVEADSLIPSWQRGSWYENPRGYAPREQWERMMGRKISRKAPARGDFTLNNTMLELKNYSLLARFMCFAMEAVIARGMGCKRGSEDPGYRMAVACSVDCPMRSTVISSGGSLPLFLAKAIVEFANGHFLRGVGTMIGLTK